MQFTIETSVSAEISSNPDLLRLHQLWLKHCAVGSIPALRDIDFESLWCVNNLMLLRANGVGDYVYQHYGANIALVAGFDMTGKMTGDFKSEVGRFFVQAYARCIADRQPLYTTNPAAHAPMVLAWERLLLPLLDDHGNVAYVLTYNRPIALNHGLLGRLLDASDDAVLGLAAQVPRSDCVDLKVLTANRAATELFELQRADVIGHRMFDVFPDWPELEIGRALVDSVRSGNATQFEWSRNCSPQRRWFRVAINPFPGGVNGIYLSQKYSISGTNA